MTLSALNPVQPGPSALTSKPSLNSPLERAAIQNTLVQRSIGMSVQQLTQASRMRRKTAYGHDHRLLRRRNRDSHLAEPTVLTGSGSQPFNDNLTPMVAGMKTSSQPKLQSGNTELSVAESRTFDGRAWQ